MRIDVLLGEARLAPTDVADRIVVVIDVLRAATTAAVALSNGALALIPFESVEAASAVAQAAERDASSDDAASVRLGGERNMVRVPGFHFGNSPLEYSADQVRGCTIMFTTTNGTRALSAAHQARQCLFAGFVNAGATIDAVCDAVSDTVRGSTSVLIVCSGTDGHVSLEDAVCAGRLVRGICAMFPELVRSDAARAAEAIEIPYQSSLDGLFRDATHARTLMNAGFDADVSYCLSVDRIPTAVRYHDGQLRAVSVVQTVTG